MMNVPVSVIKGKSPKYTSSLLVTTSPVSESVTSNSISAYRGAAKLHSLYIDSSALYFGSSK